MTGYGTLRDADSHRPTEENDAMVAQAARQVRNRRKECIVEREDYQLPITQPTSAALDTDQGNFLNDDQRTNRTALHLAGGGSSISRRLVLWRCRAGGRQHRGHFGVTRQPRFLWRQRQGNSE